MAKFIIDILSVGGNISSEIEIGFAGEELSAGDLVYLENDGKWYKAISSDESKCSTELRITVTDLITNASGSLLKYGELLSTSGTFTIGDKYYVGNIAGTITNIPPALSSTYKRYVGTANSTSSLIFHPDATYIEGDGNSVDGIIIQGISDHTLLTNIGTNTHAQIDTAIAGFLSHAANTSIHEPIPSNLAFTNVDNNFSIGQTTGLGNKVTVGYDYSQHNALYDDGILLNTNGTTQGGILTSVDGELVDFFINTHFTGARTNGLYGGAFRLDGRVGQEFFAVKHWDNTAGTTPTTFLSIEHDGATTFSGTLSASNLSGTNTGDQDLSNYAVKNADNNFSAGQTINGSVKSLNANGNYASFEAVGSAGYPRSAFILGDSDDNFSNVALWVHGGGASQKPATLEALTNGDTSTSSTKRAGIRVMTSETQIYSAYGGGNSGNTPINIYPAGLNNSPAMTFLSNLNVGVGTESPTEKLHVVGNGLFTGTLSASNLSGTNTGDQTASTLAITPFDAVTSTNTQDALEEIYGDLLIESGFKDRAESTLSFVDGTRTMSITPTGANFQFWVQNQKYIKTVADTYQIPDVEGNHYIYYDGTGSLTSTQVFTSAIITDYSFVCFVYWDTTNNKSILFGDERHGRVMDSTTHAYLHEVWSTQYVSGLGLSNLDTDGNGDVATSAQFSVGNGKIKDEDINIDIINGAPQTLETIAEIPIFYRSGVNGDWRRLDATQYPITTTGTGRAAWNEWTGVTWQLTEVSNNDFVNYHYFATNDINHPIIGIVGQVDYLQLNQARQGALTEIQDLTFGILENILPEFKAIATVIFQTSTGYTNAVKSRIRVTDEGDDYIDWRVTQITPYGGNASGDHGELAGLSDDDHLQYHNDARALTWLGTQNVAKTNVDNNFNVSQMMPGLTVSEGDSSTDFTVENTLSTGRAKMLLKNDSGTQFYFQMQGSSYITGEFGLAGTSGATDIVFGTNRDIPNSGGGRVIFATGGYSSTQDRLVINANGDVDILSGALDVSGNITGNNLSGTNTGDNAVNSLYSGLVSNATHTGDVTGSTVLTIANEAVTRAKLATRLKGSTDITQTTGTLNIDLSLGIHWNITLQSNVTSITFSNATADDVHKMVTLKFTGNYTVTIPTAIQNTTAWDDYDGTKTNQCQMYILSVASGTSITASSTLLNW